jgi:hypothetical protein
VSDFDSPWKEALDAYFRDFLAFFFHQAHAGIDWSRGYEPLDKELQQVVREAEVGRRVVDKLVKVWRTGGEEEWVLVHIEVQGQEEADFARRMYVYNYRLFDRYNRSVASLAVLGDDRPGWRPDRFGNSLWGCEVAFRFPAVKLLDFVRAEAALETSPNPFATVVLAHLKTLETRQDDEGRRTWKVRLVKGLYERGFAAADVRRLFRFIDWMMDLPPELSEAFDREMFNYEQEKHMPYVTSTERNGIRKGLMAGIATSLKIKFPQEGLNLIPEIEKLYDIDKLESVLRAIETSATAADVRKVMTGDQ